VSSSSLDSEVWKNPFFYDGGKDGGSLNRLSRGLTFSLMNSPSPCLFLSEVPCLFAPWAIDKTSGWRIGSAGLAGSAGGGGGELKIDGPPRGAAIHQG
jgi:hypothetical protein